MNELLVFERLFPRLRGWYVIVVIAIAQVIAVVGAIPGILSVQINADLAPRQAQFISVMLPALALINFGTLLYISSVSLTPAMRKRLDEIAAGRTQADLTDEFNAWRESTSLTWRYGLAAIVTTTILNILPAFFIAIIQNEVTENFVSPAPGYILFGGTAATLGAVYLGTFLIGRFTQPLRLMLVPKDFDAQLKGRSGALVVGKFLILILTLVFISVLLIAPVGYQHTFQSISEPGQAEDILNSLRVQSVFFSLLALLLGIGYSYYVSKSISDPVNDLINTLNKIEAGDLSVRAPITATDELGIVAMQFNRMVARLEDLQVRLEGQVRDRTKQLEASNEVGRVAASSLDPDQLLASVLHLFVERFDYYYAAVYLVDPSGKWAELQQATGEAGRLLKQNHHRYEITSKHIVGAAIREHTPRISQNSYEDKLRPENQLLPLTRSEVAIPLIASDRVLGALHLHSAKEGIFTPENNRTLQNMANQVAIALENARLFQEAQQNIRELRAVQKQYLLSGWTGFSSQAENLEYGVGDEFGNNNSKLDIPISLRDQILGQISLEGTEEWTPEQKSLVDAVAAQAAIALENARLVSETREIALRERMMAEINSRIWASATIDGILQTVVKELGRRLDATHATIELNLEDEA